MRHHPSVRTLFRYVQLFGPIVPLLASSVFGQSRPADFGNQRVKSHPFTLGAYFSGTYNNTQPGDPVLFANSGLNTVHDVLMPTADLHLLLQATESSPGLQQDVANAKATYPNLNGWLIYDEPNSEIFAGVGAAAAYLKQTFPEDLVYLNNGGATMAPADFKQHLDGVMTTIQPDVLAYDDYPFRILDSRLYPYFYGSMMIVRNKSQKYNVPYFGTMQSFEDLPLTYVLPTVTEYRVLAYSYLTAGFKGLWNYMYAPANVSTTLLDETGLVPPALYPVAAAVNAEIKNLGPTLTQLTSTDVRFIPGGANATPAGLQNWEGNVITNGDMESGGNSSTLPDSWFLENDGGTVGVSSDVPAGGGSQSLVMDNTSFDPVGLSVYQHPTLRDGGSYDFSMWYKGQVRIFTHGFHANYTQDIEGNMPLAHV